MIVVTVNQKPAYIVIISSDQPCPIEGQVFTECGTACPPTCAEPGPVPCTRHCLSAFFYCYSLDSHFYPCNHVSVPILHAAVSLPSPVATALLTLLLWPPPTIMLLLPSLICAVVSCLYCVTSPYFSTQLSSYMYISLRSHYPNPNPQSCYFCLLSSVL